MGDYLKNDLLLFGDLAPDVYKRSSIYDPDSDFIHFNSVALREFGLRYHGAYQTIVPRKEENP